MLIVNNLSKNTLSFFKKLSPNGACQRGLHIEQVVDLERYPLFEAESEKYRDLVSKHRGELARRGVTTLPGLVTQQALRATGGNQGGGGEGREQLHHADVS